MTHIRRQTEELRTGLAEVGLVLPEGSAALWDGDSGTLAIRTSRATLALVEKLSEARLESVPCSTGLAVQVVQAEGPALRKLVRESSGQVDHTEVWKKLEALIAAGKGMHLQTLRLQAKSGQRSQVESGADAEQITGLAVDERGEVTMLREPALAGTSLEVDAVTSESGRSVDANLAFRCALAPGVPHEIAVDKISSLGPWKLPVSDHAFAEVVTSLTAASGSTFLLAMWKPTAPAALAGQDVLQAAFLMPRVVRHLPAESGRALALLDLHADKAAPIPQVPLSPDKPVEGVRTVRMTVPSEFLGAGPVVTETGLPLPPNGKTKSVVRKAKEVLEESGIAFPEGAAAIFDDRTASLIMAHTPEMLEKVEALDLCLWNTRAPSNIHFTLEIVEADGATLRAAAKECAPLGDHAKALERLDSPQGGGSGAVKHVGTARFSTRGGQRATFRVGTLMAHDVALEPRASGAAVPDAGKDAAKSAGQPVPAASGGHAAKVRSRMVGTLLEVDPVGGADGRTVDVNLALEHHYAPPSISPPQETGAGPAAPATPLSKSATTVFHMATLKTAITLESGATRLIGLWKPQGIPGYEGKDVLQAAFLRVDWVWNRKEEW